MSKSHHISRHRQAAKRIARHALTTMVAPITDRELSDQDWLAQNYFAPLDSAPAPRLSLAEINAKLDYAAFKADCDAEDITLIPDPLGRTGASEPKSIHSPAPPSKYRVDRGNIRKYKPYVAPIY